MSTRFLGFPFYLFSLSLPQAGFREVRGSVDDPTRAFLSCVLSGRGGIPKPGAPGPDFLPQREPAMVSPGGGPVGNRKGSEGMRKGWPKKRISPTGSTPFGESSELSVFRKGRKKGRAVSPMMVPGNAPEAFRGPLDLFPSLRGLRFPGGLHELLRQERGWETGNLSLPDFFVFRGNSLASFP